MDIEFSSTVDVELVKDSASDLDVARAAWVSTKGQDARESASDRLAGLINYLMRDRHGSPFEHAQFTFFISAPIFVFREFHRHRAGWSYNEESGRYTTLKPRFYVVGDERPLQQVGKPGAYQFEAGTYAQIKGVQGQQRRIAVEAYHAYEKMLADGVAREVARMVLPTSIYSSMYASCNARSLMHFLSLRTTAPEASVPSFPQLEIAMDGDKLEGIFAGAMPKTYGAWVLNGRVAP